MKKINSNPYQKNPLPQQDENNIRSDRAERVEKLR